MEGDDQKKEMIEGIEEQRAFYTRAKRRGAALLDRAPDTLTSVSHLGSVLKRRKRYTDQI